MALVSLREFIDQLDSFGDDESVVYLNRQTGEFVFASGEDRRAAEREEEEDYIADWQREILPKIREAMSSEDWLMLPSKFELDEYRLMRDFSATVADKALAQDLLDTIGGQGTFRRFKNMLDRRNLLDDWYKFRDRVTAIRGRVAGSSRNSLSGLT